jgi:hypothetical protein
MDFEQDKPEIFPEARIVTNSTPIIKEYSARALIKYTRKGISTVVGGEEVERNLEIYRGAECGKDISLFTSNTSDLTDAENPNIEGL